MKSCNEIVAKGKDNGSADASHITVAAPPPVTNKTSKRQGCKSQVNNARIQAFRWLFSQLLRCFSTNGALGRDRLGTRKT